MTTNNEEDMICRYCNKNVDSYTGYEGMSMMFDDFYGYNESLRVCRCKGIDPLNKDPTARKNWVVYGAKGHVVDVNPYTDSMMTRSAEFSEDRTYRYKLGRIWEPTQNKILFIMLNPSTADADDDDKTIKKLLEITKKWGLANNYGGFYVGNLYPYCSPRPLDLRDHQIPDEIHAKNIKSIEEMAAESSTIVFAWGTKGPNERQMPPEWLRKIAGRHAWCINKSIKGVPMHPNQWGSNVMPIPDEPTLFRY